MTAKYTFILKQSQNTKLCIILIVQTNTSEPKYFKKRFKY